MEDASRNPVQKEFAGTESKSETEDGVKFITVLPDMVKGKFGAYCKNKCDMNVSRAMGEELTDSQVKSMPKGTTDYSYIKDGKEIKGFQYKVKLEFPKKKIV